MKLSQPIRLIIDRVTIIDTYGRLRKSLRGDAFGALEECVASMDMQGIVGIALNYRGLNVQVDLQ